MLAHFITTSHDQLKRVRCALATDPSPFEDLFKDPDFAGRFGRDFDRAETLVRGPKGFDSAHPKYDWVKLKRFIVWRRVPLDEFTPEGFADHAIEDYRQLLRLNERLLSALGRPH